MELIIGIIIIIALIFIVINSQEDKSSLQPEYSEKRIQLLKVYREAIKVGDTVLAINTFIALFNELMKIEDMAYLQKVNISKGYYKELIEMKSEVSINDLMLSIDFSKEQLLILSQIKELGILTNEEFIHVKPEVIKESKYIPKKKPIHKRLS